MSISLKLIHDINVHYNILFFAHKGFILNALRKDRVFFYVTMYTVKCIESFSRISELLKMTSDPV